MSFAITLNHILVHINTLACDFDLGQTMPNIKFVRVNSIYYNVFKFHVPRSISFELSCKNTHIQKHTQTRTHTHTDAHNDSDEYSELRFAKMQL